VEDFIAFSQGRDSVIGRTIKVLQEDFPNAFRVLKNVFDLISAVIQNQIAAWKNLFDFIIFGFNSVIDFFKNTILPFFKDSFVGKIFEKLGDFFSSEGFNNAIKSATEAVKGSTATLEGKETEVGEPVSIVKRIQQANEVAQGTASVIQERSSQPLPAPISSPTSSNQTNNVTSNFTINADSLTKEEATTAVESGVEKAMSGMLRSTERDVTPAVER